MRLEIRTMLPSDWNTVSQIYREGIASGFATFEQQVPTYALWDKSHVTNCRFIAKNETSILGWAAISPVSNRNVYRGVAEVSIYVGKIARGKGVGTKLLQHLITESEAAGFWTLQSGIFPENKASIQLHEKLGFRYLGKRERVGKTKDGVWKDNLIFERRSTLVGIDESI